MPSAANSRDNCMLRIAIATPTYQEAGNIETLLKGLSAACGTVDDVDFTVFVLDDSSPDGTAQVVRSVAPSYETSRFHIEIVVKKDKAGLGAAYIHGFNIILARDFDYVLQMDADMSHDPGYIPQFVTAAQAGTEFVVASRYIPGGGTPDWTWKRKFLSRGGNTYARLVLSRRMTDYTGGFNLYSSRLLSEILRDPISANGYGFLLVLKYRALLECRSFSEIPIIFVDRTHGTSKMPKGTLWKNFALVPQIRARSGRVL